MSYIANTTVTVKKKTFKEGEVITEEIPSGNIHFLLREGYIKEPEKKKAEDASAAKTGNSKPSKKSAEEKSSVRAETVK